MGRREVGGMRGRARGAARGRDGRCSADRALEDVGRERRARRRAGRRHARAARPGLRGAGSGTTPYVAGDFRYVGPETGSVVGLDMFSGAASGSWAVVDGFVAASASD